MLAYAMMPFGYISLYAADRAFYAADVAAGLYHPLAYYLASATAAAPLLVANTLCGAYAAYGLANLGPSPRQVFAFGGFMALQGLLAAQLLVAVRRFFFWFWSFFFGLCFSARFKGEERVNFLALRFTRSNKKK